jgi:excisionase family DNA binding protein
MAAVATQTDDTTRWLTPPEIASRLGVARDKIMAWIRRGELTAVDLSESRGRRPRYRVDPRELERFLARRATTPPPAKTARRAPRPANVREFV